MRSLLPVTYFVFAATSLLPAGTAAPIALNLNENPFGPSPRAAEAIRRDLGQLERYTGAEADAFARAAAQREGVPVEQIVIGEILEPLGQQLALEPGDKKEFVYSVPGYTALVDAAAPFGGIGRPVPLNDRLENDLPALGAAIGPHTRALFLINPHNPSGTVSDPAAFHAFLREAAQHALVIVDEAYLEFSDDFAGRTAVAHTRAGENVLVFRTFSKAYGLAALPFGYAVAPTPLADRLRKAGVGAPRSLNRLALTAATAALADQDQIASIRDRVATERATWNALFDQLHLRHTESAGNFVFFQTGRLHADFARALRSQGVEIGRGFPPYNDWARISLGLPEENRRAQDLVRQLLQPDRAPVAP